MYQSNISVNWAGVRVLWFGHSRCCLFKLLWVNQCVVLFVSHQVFRSLHSQCFRQWVVFLTEVTLSLGVRSRGKLFFSSFFSLPAFIVWINYFVVYGEIIAQFIKVSKLDYICFDYCCRVFMHIICGINLNWIILKIDGYIKSLQLMGFLLTRKLTCTALVTISFFFFNLTTSGW